ncbi:uncharacterized protein LOC129918198 [Episyrphus balteatus]|uniref:uncharacterized protein LOC129918198 n=1 Tax=Episyrphus balteatus TaxID=286459 RepID=UPI0024857CAB|nr:uncharacterized protein LOC129918198 [Episyrphus balteatus]
MRYLFLVTRHLFYCLLSVLRSFRRCVFHSSVLCKVRVLCVFCLDDFVNLTRNKEYNNQFKMFSNLNDVTSDSVDVIKEEVRELDEICFENDLRDLICRQFGLSEEIYLRLIECRIDIESLLFIKDDDIKELFPTNMLGLRIKFRTSLSQWQQQHMGQKISPPKRAPIRVISPTPRISRVISSSPARMSVPTQRRSVDQSQLYVLLQSSVKGQTILNHYEKHSKLLDEHRVALVSVIVDYHVDRGMAMSMSDIVRYTEEIGIVFPTEEKRYYYSTRGKGLNPMGKLYDKAINARRKVKRPWQSEEAPSPKTRNSEIDIVVASADELAKKSWLSQNMKPWDEVLNKWRKTFRVRRTDILKGEDVLENWPLFKNPIGYNLIDVDFVELYPDSPKDILEEWQFFREHIVPYLKEKIKDPDSKELMENLNNELSTDSKDCLIVLLLNAVIKPPLLSSKLLNPNGSGDKRRKWKPSISDAQNATVMHCVDMADYQIKCEQVKLEASEKNKTLQPLIVVVGEELTNLESFYVLYDCIVYKTNSFIKSLDILIKLYYVMNMDFRLEAKYFYELIESYFLKIKISSNPNIISLTNYLNDNKN